MLNWIVLYYGTQLNNTLWSFSHFLLTRTCILNRLWKCFTVKLFPVQTHCICIDVISGVTEKQPEHSQAFQCFLRPEPATPRVLGGIPPGVSLRLSLNHCSRSSSPGQKRCVPALHSNVELHRGQFHSLWSSSSGSGTILIQDSGSAERPV